MEIDKLITILSIIGVASIVFYLMFRVSKYALFLNFIMLSCLILFLNEVNELVSILLYLVCPLMLINIGLYVFMHKTENTQNNDRKYQVSFATSKGSFKLDNIKRGASVIGSAGSGKTESVVYGFLKHFEKEGFCGIIHDYKDFELTEMAYPLFKDSDIPFKVISFDKIIHRVNPIAPRYLENEESVNEVSRVLIENLIRAKGKWHNRNNKVFQRCSRGFDWWIDLEIKNHLSTFLYVATFNSYLSILGYR